MLSTKSIKKPMVLSTAFGIVPANIPMINAMIPLKIDVARPIIKLFDIPFMVRKNTSLPR